MESRSGGAPQPAERCITLPLNRIHARRVLRYNSDPNLLVMCRGYNGEDHLFTELVWEDDRHLDFEDRASYPEFQIWLRVQAGPSAP